MNDIYDMISDQIMMNNPVELLDILHEYPGYDLNYCKKEKEKEKLDYLEKIKYYETRCTKKFTR